MTRLSAYKEFYTAPEQNIIYARGTGYDRLSPAVVQVNGIDLLSSSETRGLHVVTINRNTLQKVTEATFDTYGNRYETQLNENASVYDFIHYLSTLDDSVFIIIVSYDAVFWHENENSLESYGGNVVNIIAGNERTPFAFVGYKGLSAGSALQISTRTGVTAAYAEISTYVADKTFTTVHTTDPALSLLLDMNTVQISCDAQGVATSIKAPTKLVGRFGNVSVDFAMFDLTNTKFYFEDAPNSKISIVEMDGGSLLVNNSHNLKVGGGDNGDGLSITIQIANETAVCSECVICADVVLYYHDVRYAQSIRIPVSLTKIGETGNTGRILYMAGIYNNNTSYSYTAKSAPIVLENKEYYYIGKEGEGTISGLDPATDYAANGTNATWIKGDSFNFVFSEILFAKFGKLASAVFSGDFMMSQNGKDSEGAASSDYESFLEFDPYQEHNRGFTPNFLINLLTGAFHGCGGKAMFNADGSGYLAGGSISWDSSGNPSLKIGTDTEYILIGLSNNLPYLELHSGTLNQGDAVTPILTIGKTGTYNLIKMYSEWGEITFGNGTLKIGNSIYMSTDEGIVVNEGSFSVKRNGTAYPVSIDSNGFLKI